MTSGIHKQQTIVDLPSIPEWKTPTPIFEAYSFNQYFKWQSKKITTKIMKALMKAYHVVDVPKVVQNK
jgi:hypothetical protein